VNERVNEEVKEKVKESEEIKAIPDELCQDASDGPQVDGLTVRFVRRQQYLGAAVPARDHVFRHGILLRVVE
jgi:hypothetical protein